MNEIDSNFFVECDCCNEDIKKVIDEYRDQIKKLEEKNGNLQGTCAKLLELGVSPEIVAQVWDSGNSSSRMTFSKYYATHMRELDIIADLAELLSSKKCMSIYENGKYRNFTQREMIQRLLDRYSKDNWPRYTVDEFIESIIAEK